MPSTMQIDDELEDVKIDPLERFKYEFSLNQLTVWLVKNNVCEFS